MWYLNDVFSLLIGVCIEEALGLAHRAQQKHRSLSTSRTIQQQLQRSLILAGKLRGETKKSRELFANQWSTSWSIDNIETIENRRTRISPNTKTLMYLFGEWSSKPFLGGALFEAQFFDAVLNLKFLRRHFGLCTSVHDGTETKHIALRSFEHGEDEHGDLKSFDMTHFGEYSSKWWFNHHRLKFNSTWENLTSSWRGSA